MSSKHCVFLHPKLVKSISFIKTKSHLMRGVRGPLGPTSLPGMTQEFQLFDCHSHAPPSKSVSSWKRVGHEIAEQRWKFTQHYPNSKPICCVVPDVTNADHTHSEENAAGWDKENKNPPLKCGEQEAPSFPAKIAIDSKNATVLRVFNMTNWQSPLHDLSQSPMWISKPTTDKK